MGATTSPSSPAIPTITPGATPDTGVAGPRLPSSATANASNEPFFSDTVFLAPVSPARVSRGGYVESHGGKNIVARGLRRLETQQYASAEPAKSAGTNSALP